ncbi:MAG TPA: flagellin [Bryobacteraceae bacterium]|nr:flagellin [Bryobacteraceae bacterium]
MAFSIQTNINSLIAQENLRVNSEFQGRTIQRLTSGFRINQSGDDAAGLAIANKFRSDVAELTQGVRNANDGISSLQIVDGGMNNISKMLDRLKTLATQSASATFTGDRAVLNNEFSTLLTEIDRQSQAIGMDDGGTLAKSLSVFIGGGLAHGTNEISTANGSVTIDLASAAVDTRSLGLKGMQVVAGTTDLGSASETSVAKILADTGNTTETSGYTDFYVSGPGFSGDAKVKVSVNVQGVTDMDSLATAVNAAIQAAGNGTTPAASAMKAAGIVASVHTDANGGKQLAFTSSTTAFQVQAGDRMANAIMGNLTGTTGTAVATTVAGVATTAGAFTPTNVTVRITGGGMSDAVDLTFESGSTTTALALTDLSAKVGSNAALQAAGIKVSGGVGEALTFTSAQGEQFNVMVTGDTANLLGFGSFVAGTGGAAEYTSIQGAVYDDATAAGNAKLEFSFNGATSDANVVTIALGAGSVAIADVVDSLNAAFNTNATLQGAGLKASVAGTQITISSTNDTQFRVTAGGSDAAADLGFGVAGTSFATLTAGASAASTANATGATHTGALSFTALSYGNSDQAVTVSAIDAKGAMKSATVTLQNDATATTGQSIDDAIAHINQQLQQTNDSTLQQIVAVKQNVAGTEKINFISSLKEFSVSVGSSAHAQGIGGGTAQTVASTTYGEGANIAIESREGAIQAVSALGNAVKTLGTAQAAVGKAQNQLGYALALAQSQISNYSGAESRIRDADIAAEAANLTKAQVLQQASLAAMAQANSAPQAVLALLRG